MSIPVCKFYSLNQTCRFGKHCRYLHSVSQRPPPLLQHSVNDQDEEHLKSTPSSSLSTPDKETRPNICHNEATVSESQPPTSGTSSQHQEPNKEVPDHQDASLKEGNTHQKQKKNCHYFLSYGNCRYGEQCRFSHQLPHDTHIYRSHNSSNARLHDSRAKVPPRFRNKGGQRDTGASKPLEDHESADITADQTQGNEKSSLLTKKGPPTPQRGSRNFAARGQRHNERRICPFFKSGRCNRNERCRFLHVQEEALASDIGEIKSQGQAVTAVEDEGESRPAQNQTENGNPPVIDKTSKSNAVQRPFGVKQMFSYAELQDIGQEKVRESEINTIKKRFPHDKITVLEDGKDKFLAQISMSPSDPDWPFDVNVFELLFTVPADYPKQMMVIQVSTDQDLPETLRRYLEVSIKEWLDHKSEQLALSGKVELVFRPFLRWFDRNIEDIITEALKQLKRELTARAAGLEFIPAQRLQAKFRDKSESSGGEENNPSGEEEETTEESGEGTEEDESSDEDGEDANTPSLDLSPDKKGTEMTLRQLQLRENATALMFERLSIVLQCGRCKNHTDLSVPQGRVMSLRCEKCNQNQFVNYRAALIHQFSSAIGYLDVDGCQAFDLILQDCRVAVTCMACSKQTRIDGLASGQMVDGWCQACNAKFKLATESVKFTQLVPSGIDTSINKVVEVSSSKSKKPPKDPAIKEGYPLPGFGTCKHYKHSYRWLRFPCCGKAYPCDVCHDKKEDHEMQMASRMICGHCCKEQNFSAMKPCNACGQHLTKIRTAHWEGGSGCRDKISMSRNDQQKYKNMNKTTSNKKKALSGASKKKTKLSHS